MWSWTLQIGNTFLCSIPISVCFWTRQNKKFVTDHSKKESCTSLAENGIEKAAKWVKRKKVRRSKKNIAGQVLTYNSKNFHWLNRKLDQVLWMDWENHLEKKSDPRNRKNSKNQSEIAACEQKTSEKANFCSNTVFSLYFKFRAKKFHSAKALAFSLLFLFRRDQNQYSNLTSKIMKMCEQILKKDSAPMQFKSFEL